MQDESDYCPHLARWTEIPLCSIGWALMTQCSTQSRHDPHAPRVCINGMLCLEQGESHPSLEHQPPLGWNWHHPSQANNTNCWHFAQPFGRVPPTQCDLFAQPRNHCLTTSWVKLLGWWWLKMMVMASLFHPLECELNAASNIGCVLKCRATCIKLLVGPILSRIVFFPLHFGIHNWFVVLCDATTRSKRCMDGLNCNWKRVRSKVNPHLTRFICEWWTCDNSYNGIVAKVNTYCTWHYAWTFSIYKK